MSDNMVTFNGVRVPEADVLAAAAEIQQRKEPKPVEPGVYRWSETTDADPFGVNRYTVRRKNTDGSWDWSPAWGDKWKRCSRSARFIDDYALSGLLVPLQPVEGVEYEGGHDGMRRRWRNDRWEFWRDSLRCWDVSPSGADLWRTGQLRPVQPQPWTPTVNEWVQHKTQPWDKARQITSIGEFDIWCLDGYANRQNVRPATPDEITAAKRIEVKDRLIVRNKTDGSVWQYNMRPEWWTRLDAMASPDRLVTLTLDHYDILPEYTVQGAK